MGRAVFAVTQPHNHNPITDAARFVVTPLDVGSDAVRPGCMANIERDRQALLIASRMVLNRLRDGNIQIGAAYEFALQTAVTMAEAPR